MVWFVCDNGAVLSLLGTDALDFALAALAASALLTASMALWYSTTPRNENPVNENHLEICLSFSQKNRN